MTPLISFHQPLTSATLAGPARGYTEEEIAAIRQQAYDEGLAAGKDETDQRLVDMRYEVQTLQHGLLDRLKTVEKEFVGQLQNALPALAVDLARRLLAGYEPSAAAIETHCREVLEQLYPERENLELIVCPRDAELLIKNSPDLIARYPGLKISPDTQLHPGDCQIRSRFGITDARLSAKLETLERELLSA